MPVFALTSPPSCSQATIPVASGVLPPVAIIAGVALVAIAGAVVVEQVVGQVVAGQHVVLINALSAGPSPFPGDRPTR